VISVKTEFHLISEMKSNYSLKFGGNDVNIIESRPHWQDNNIWTEMPIAKIRYLPKTMLWQLLWIRANGKWQKYPELEPCKDLRKVIMEIDTDPIHVFWG